MLHKGPLALEGASFQQLSQDQECDSREQGSQASKRGETCCS